MKKKENTAKGKNTAAQTAPWKMSLPARELRKSQRFVESLLENIPDMIFVKDARDLRFVRMNKAGEELIGVSRSELLGKGDYDLFPPEEADFFIARDRETLAGGKKLVIPEEQIQTRSRGLRWLHTKKIPLLDEQGNPEYLLGISEDITERKKLEDERQRMNADLQEMVSRSTVELRKTNRTLKAEIAERKKAEEKLRENELKYRSLYQEFRSILDAIPDSLALLSPDLKIVWANAVAAADMHVEMADFIGQHCYRVRHGRSEPCEACTVLKSFSSGKAATGESITPEGRVWELYALPVFDDKGEVKGAIEVARNITEKRKAENALRESENRYRTIFDNTGTAMVIIEEDTTISLANAEFEKLTGCRRRDVEGKKSWTEFAIEEEREQLMALHRLRRVDTAAAPAKYECHLLDNDGNVKHLMLNVAMIPGTPKSVASFLDITERKRSEEALRESEEKYRNILESINDGYFEVDLGGNFTFCNKVVHQSLGHSHDEIVGKNFRTIMDPENAELVENHFHHVYQHDIREKVISYKVLRKDGTVAYTETSFSLKKDKDGRPAGFRGISRDVTGRKRAEKALRESEIRYQSIFENTGTGVLIVEDDMTISFANAEFEKLTGYKRQEVEGKKKWTVFVDPSDLERMVEQHRLRRSDKNQAKRSYEFRLVHRDGRRRHAFLTVDIIPGTSRSVASLMDITERKQAEEALRQSEKQHRSVIENMRDTFYRCDLRGRLLMMSPSGAKMFGYDSIDEMIGLPVKSLWYHPRDRERFFEQVATTGRANDYEAVLKKKDGTAFNVSFTTHFHGDEQGHRLGTEGIIRDITERKRMEEERARLEERLRRAEKMEALGTLAGGVAHDLNNVLGVLVGYAELLQRFVPDGGPLKRYAFNILQSGQRGAAIIQDLLTLARRGVAISEVVNLNIVVSDYLNTPEYEKLKTHHPQVTIRTDLETDLLNIKGSPVHLTKTVMNLVSNASEAIPGPGEVTIRTDNLYLDKPIRGYDDVKEGDYVVLTVSDTGEGISPLDFGKIFEPFYTKKVMGRSGTGLGLAVVWGTVKDHNGYIDVQSEKGKGSSFVLYFPICREAPTGSRREISPDAYRGNGESILVVDDVEGQRELAVNILTHLGYTARAVSSGEEAVEYLKQYKADLLVLDMIMSPGIDGLETYQRILKIRPMQKAVIVSGFSETERVRKTLELGAGTYVRKPYLMEKIGLAIREELLKAAHGHRKA